MILRLITLLLSSRIIHQTDLWDQWDLNAVRTECCWPVSLFEPYYKRLMIGQVRSAEFSLFSFFSLYTGLFTQYLSLRCLKSREITSHSVVTMKWRSLEGRKPHLLMVTSRIHIHSLKNSSPEIWSSPRPILSDCIWHKGKALPIDSCKGARERRPPFYETARHWKNIFFRTLRSFEILLKFENEIKFLLGLGKFY